MTLLYNSIDNKKFDTRIIERNLERGSITPKEAEKQAKDLPDDSDNASWVSTEDLARAEDA